MGDDWRSSLHEDVEIRRDEKRNLWSIFDTRGHFVDRAETVMLESPSFLVTRSRALDMLAGGARRNDAAVVNGILIETPPEGWLLNGLRTVAFNVSRATTWVYSGTGVPLYRSGFARFLDNGTIMVQPAPFARTLLSGGSRRRATSATSLRQVSRLLQKKGADWCLTAEQPLRAAEFLYHYGVEDPVYAIWPTGNPWTDTPHFFEKLSELRAWCKAPQDTPEARKHEKLVPFPSRVSEPKKPTTLPPFDIVKHYKERLAKLGFVFIPGEQPQDYLGTGMLYYVVTERVAPKNGALWEDFPFHTREALDEWLESKENMLVK